MALQTSPHNVRREASAEFGPLRRSSAGAATLSRQTHGGALAMPARAESESRLVVGPSIKLKTVAITDCDTLLIDGSVEATMELRVIQINERGAYTGTAEVDSASIRGRFDGVLLVRETLVIHATGRVAGRVRYGRIVIEEGGEISGDIERVATPESAGVPPALQVVSAG